MRKTLLSIIGLLCFVIMQAQVTKTVNMTQAGTLASVLTKDEKNTITDLTLTGSIDARDFKTMRDLMPLLAVLNMEGANIVEYSGSEGTYGSLAYPANEIPDHAFFKGNNTINKILKRVKLPSDLNTIGYSAFECCYGLTGELDLPLKLTSIKSGAFRKCISLVGELRLPPKLTSIDSYVFSECSGFTGELKLPSGITLIGDHAFSNCYRLKGKLDLPGGVTIIERYAFSNCYGLVGELSLPSGLNIIGEFAFERCSGLTSIRLMTQIPPQIEFSTFAASSIKTIFVPKGSKSVYTASTVWKNFSIVDDEKAYMLHISTPGTLGVTLINAGGRPNSVTSLELTGELNSDDFLLIRESMPLLHTLNMEGLSNKSIPNDAFKEKATLLDLKLPAGITAIGINAFNYCSGLTGELKLPAGITTIGISAFYNCSGLTSIEFPAGITAIGQSAFSGCKGLTGELKLPAGITAIGDYAFNNCSGLTGELKVPAGITAIAERAFTACSDLTGIHIKKNVKNIYNSAFSGCSNVSKITCEAVTPPSLGTDAFKDINAENCELYVPQGSRMNYLLAPQWGAFTNIIEMDVPAESYLASFAITPGGTVQCNGTAVSNGSKIEIKAGESMNLAFAPQAGYALDQVLYDGEDVTAQVQNNQWTSPAVSKAVTVSVSFKAVQYEVAIFTVGSGVMNAHIVEYNSTHTYRLAATEGYLIESVTLNGAYITPGLVSGKLTLHNITENQTIVITSKRDGETSEIGVSPDKTIRTWKANGQLFVESTEEMSAAEVVDMSGRMACSISKTAYAYVLNLPSNGVYVVRIRTASGEVKTVKVAM